MKTFIRGFLTTLLIVTFTLIPLVMYVEKTINEDLLGAYLEDTISDNLKENMKSEEVFDLTEEEQQALEEEFENNESLQEFVNKYKVNCHDKRGLPVNPLPSDMFDAKSAKRYACIDAERYSERKKSQCDNPPFGRNIFHHYLYCGRDKTSKNQS